MLFNSLGFLIFFVVIYSIYLVLPFRPQNLLLVIASYFFYGWWDTRFLFLLALSTTVDYWVGLVLDRGRLTLTQKVAPALFLIAAGYVFLCTDLTAIEKRRPDEFLTGLVSQPEKIAFTLGGIVAFILLLFVIYNVVEGVLTPRSRFCTLLVSLVTQLGLLATFKYFNFFAENMQLLLNTFGAGHLDFIDINIILPVGISFYTFQSLSYTIDIYRRQFKPTDNFLDFALFVSYFPQLQAGPIERGRQIIHQLSAPRRHQAGQILDGLYLILLGFFKKTAIADAVAPVVDHVFNSTGRVSWIDILVSVFLFSIQIYCDFSGYIDIARGVSKLFGIELMSNFDHPYFSTNAQEFWRRWNISLSNWLRDYLYIPLGGSLGGLASTCRNLMITMLLGGLWHGAAWNFILWGFYQGAMLCVNRVWIEYHGRDRGAAGAMLPLSGRIVANMFFFVLVCYGWLIFRAHSFSQIADFTSRIFADFGDLDYGAGAPRLSCFSGIAILAVLELAQFSSGDEYVHRRLSAPLKGLFLAALLVTILMGMSNDPAQFIYFKF
jgi:alginate O-acetyltransferase complex protein AlgI